MTSRALDPCVTVVAGNPGGTAETPLPHLAATGADLSLLPWVALGAVVVVLVGFVALMRRCRLAAVAPAVVLLAVTLGVISALGVASPSQAANASRGDAQQCALISVSNVQRGEAENLLPGAKAGALSLTVTNVTAEPIELRATLAPTGGTPHAFVADIAEGAEVLATHLLSNAPSTASLTLAPGAHIDLRVSVALASATADAGATATFDAVFTAASD